jgi:hypothetical protein
MQGTRIDLKIFRLAHTFALYQPVVPGIPVFLRPNNRLTGTFSWINPYGRPFFLIKCCYRGLSGIVSGIITTVRGLLGVYQEFPARHRPDAEV